MTITVLRKTTELKREPQPQPLPRREPVKCYATPHPCECCNP